MSFYFPIATQRRVVTSIKPMVNPVYKRMLWKSVSIKRDAWERRFSLLFRTVLNKEFKKLAERIDNTNYRDLELPNKIMTHEPIEKMFIQLYTNVGSAFAKEQFNKHKRIDRHLFLKGNAENDWNESFKNYVKTKAGKKIVSITEENRSQAVKVIRKVLDYSVEEGMGADETARAIRKGLTDVAADINQWRALRIARTEVMTASNLGAMEGARATDLPMDKFWIATYDERTRDTHIAVETQNPIDMNDYFKVGEADMMQPGEAVNGDFPEEIINCRCTVAFEVKEEAL
jgi:hypothetical protein